MANASQVRAALEKEFGRLRKASEQFEARLKSTADDVTTGAQALEKVWAKEVPPNVSAGLKVIEKELAAYRKAGERELARLSKSYDRELAKLRKAKERVEKKVTKKAAAKPAPKPTEPPPATETHAPAKSRDRAELPALQGTAARPVACDRAAPG